MRTVQKRPVDFHGFRPQQVTELTVPMDIGFSPVRAVLAEPGFMHVSQIPGDAGWEDLEQPLPTMFMTCTCSPRTRNAAPGNKSCIVLSCEHLRATWGMPPSQFWIVRTRTGELVQSARCYRTARVAPAPAVRSPDPRATAPETRASG